MSWIQGLPQGKWYPEHCWCRIRYRNNTEDGGGATWKRVFEFSLIYSRHILYWLPAQASLAVAHLFTKISRLYLLHVEAC